MDVDFHAIHVSRTVPTRSRATHFRLQDALIVPRAMNTRVCRTTSSENFFTVREKAVFLLDVAFARNKRLANPVDSTLVDSTSSTSSDL